MQFVADTILVDTSEGADHFFFFFYRGWGESISPECKKKMGFAVDFRFMTDPLHQPAPYEFITAHTNLTKAYWPSHLQRRIVEIPPKHNKTMMRTARTPPV